MDDQQTAEYLAGRGRQAAEHQEELVRRVQDAKQALKLSMGTVNQEWIEVDERASKMLHDLRATRMAIDSELSKIMSQLADVRKFFLSSDHETEVARLKEFVELCERLQKLKDTGFLDRVTDTILKLENV